MKMKQRKIRNGEYIRAKNNVINKAQEEIMKEKYSRKLSSFKYKYNNNSFKINGNREHKNG